jgi:methylmalonyl-CoA mutase
MPENNFYSDFNHRAVRDWEKVAQQELGDKNPWKKLTKAKLGVTIKPYYDLTDAVTERKTHLPGVARWQNVPKVIVIDEKKANEEALAHLNAGADGVWFDLQQQVKVDVLLKKIELPFCAVYFSAKEDSLLSELADFIESKSMQEKVTGAFLWNTPKNIQRRFNSWKNFHPVGIIAKENVNIVDEIVDSLLTAVDIIEKLKNENYSKEQAFHALAFSVSVGTDFFLSLAKIRALRNLWLTLQEAYQIINPIPAFIHAHAQPWIKENFHPHGNMLYQTMAAMAAVMGGCNVLTCEGESYSDKTMTRIARNVSLMLSEEAHLSKVNDPLAGSFYVDAITHSLANEAWKKFQQA